ESVAELRARRCVVSPADLRDSREARRHAQQSLEARRVEPERLEKDRADRPRPDQPHVAADHIDQLRHLIDLAALQKAAELRRMRGALFAAEQARADLLLRSWAKRAEFVDREDPAAAPEAFAPIEHRPFARELDAGGDDGEER